MSGLVCFDRSGAFGPAMTLIYNVDYYNDKGLSELAEVLKQNFTKLSGVKPKGKKEFCAYVLEKNKTQIPITPLDIIGTRFFQNMQKKLPSQIHEKVLGSVVPTMLKTVCQHFPKAQKNYQEAGNDNQEAAKEIQLLKEWVAGFVESYMKEAEIEQHCKLQETISNNIMEERRAIGESLQKAAEAKNFNEKDLDSLIDASRSAISFLHKSSNHFASTLHFTGKYLSLFSKDSDSPQTLADDVLNKLNGIFRQKMFPKSGNQ